MRPSAVTIDARFREHDPGAGHPERPDRIAVLEDLIAGWRGPRLEHVAARLASEDEIRAAHSAGLVEQVRATQGQRRCRIDADTATSERSYETALLAAGGLVELADAVATGAYRNGFAFVRPPGHHATATQAMGFCLFNNAAVAAEHARAAHGAERVLILDWDVHHGNGTEAIFYESPHVLYSSIHQSPLYPGTGAATDFGSGDGEGFTVNLPVPPGAGPDEFLSLVQGVVAPIAREWRPGLLCISAGYDAHRDDPLANCELDDAAFGDLAATMRDLATELGAPVLICLEGGYSLAALSRSVVETLEAFSGDREPRTAPAEPGGAYRERLAPLWPVLERA